MSTLNRDFRVPTFFTGSFYKFTFVREPMERLASCYHDKFVINPAKNLIRFRRKVKEVSFQFHHVVNGNFSDLVTFEEFLQVNVLKSNDFR